MAKCSFCGVVIVQGRGKLYAKKDGKIFNFCSMKCEKNMVDMKRKPWKIRWTKDFQKAKKKG